MSLILEALRKSEAERRLGSAPDVLAPMPVMHATAPRQRQGWRVAGAIALVVMLAAGWWWIREATTAPAAVIASVAPRGPIAVATVPEVDANESRTPYSPAVAPAPLAPPTAVPSPVPVRASPAPVSLPTPSRTPRPLPSTAQAAPVAAATIRPLSQPVSARPAIILPDLAPAPRFLPPPPPPPPSPAADEPALPSIANLLPDERAGLPALKITMHVYAGNPTDRFMIIDGQRVVEGARLGADVTLVHIRRDGAEIEAQGRHLLLPNP